MNALVASVIRTLVPVIVGQVASWLLLAHVVLPVAALTGLTAFVGGLLTAIYYVGVRVLEQQWPSLGILLGLPSSPDTYSKSTVTAAAPQTPTVNPAPVASILAPVADTTLPTVDGGFQSKIEAAINGAPEPVPATEVTPVYTAP
jgi:hypothetical protein